MVAYKIIDYNRKIYMVLDEDMKVQLKCKLVEARKEVCPWKIGYW